MSNPTPILWVCQSNSTSKCHIPDPSLLRLKLDVACTVLTPPWVRPTNSGGQGVGANNLTRNGACPFQQDRKEALSPTAQTALHTLTHMGAISSSLSSGPNFLQQIEFGFKMILPSPSTCCLLAFVCVSLVKLM